MTVRHKTPGLLLPALAALTLALVASAGAEPLSFSATKAIDVGEAPVNRVALADLDGDGDQDVVRSGPEDRGLVVFLNRGDGTLDPLPLVAPELLVRQLGSRDLDGDGIDELIAAGLAEEGSVERFELRLFTSDGTGRLTATELASGADGYDRPVFVDLDDDGDDDLACYTDPDPDPVGLITFLNDGSGGLVAGPMAETRISIRQAVFGDLDGDGLPDLWCFRYTGSAVFPNLGEARFGYEEETEARGSWIVDVTGDGLADLVEMDGTVYAGFGNRHFAAPRHPDGFRLSATATARRATLADLDGDGDLDLVGNYYSNRVSIRLNDGNGVFGRSHEYRLDPEDLSTIRYLHVGDFDGNGEPDIFAHAWLGCRLLTPDGPPPPSLDSIEPAEVRSGDRHDFVLTGTGFTPETTVDFGDGNTVVAVKYESDTRLVATVDLAPVWYDHPGFPLGVDVPVAVEGPSGAGSRLATALQLLSYWDDEISLRAGKLVDSDLPGSDKFRVRGRFRPRTLDRILEDEGGDLLLVFGSADNMFEISVSGDDPRWKAKRNAEGQVTRLKWKSPPGAAPRLEFLLRSRKSKFQMRAGSFDFPGEQDRNIRVELYLGEHRATGEEKWNRVGTNQFRSR
jgi:hypothetical protein